MPYAVEADLNLDATRIIELTENASAIGVKDAALIAQLETESEGIVNAFIGGSVTLPFVSIPPIIKFITATIWARRLYRHREIMPVPVNLEEDYTLAMDMLRQIAAGTLPIDPIVDSTIGVPVVESSEARGWTPRDLVS